MSRTALISGWDRRARYLCERVRDLRKENSILKLGKKKNSCPPMTRYAVFPWTLYMDPVGKRDQKRQSARKNSERSIYTQKAVRAKEALTAKKLATSINK